MHSLMERSISGLRSVIHGPALSLSLTEECWRVVTSALIVLIVRLWQASSASRHRSRRDTPRAWAP